MWRYHINVFLKNKNYVDLEVGFFHSFKGLYYNYNFNSALPRVPEIKGLDRQTDGENIMK